MFKLMKHEFRKMRTVLGILCLALVALEAAFLIGDHLDNARVSGVSLALLAVLAFAVYLYILFAGIISFARELNDRTGYMVFMAPVSPAAIVASKLLFTIIAALLMGALFGGAAYYDVTRLLRGAEMDPQIFEHLNFAFRVYLGNGQFDLTALFLNVAIIGGSVIIEILAVMCAAYLAITLAATMLQNRRGFMRFLLSFVIFAALQYLMRLATDRLLGTASADSLAEAAGYLYRNLALDGAFCVLFAGASAVLLDRKVSL